MKKSLQLLVTGAMFAAGAMTASADRYYQTADPVSPFSIEEGVQYALQGGQHEANSTYAYLTGTSFTFKANMTTASLYTFEVAGKTEDGTTIYYLKNSEGAYFTKPGRDLGYTTNKDNAWKVTVKEAVAYDNKYEYSTDDDDFQGMEAYVEEAKAAGNPFDFSCATYLEVGEGVVIASAEPDKAGDPYSTYTSLLSLASGDATSGDVARGSENWQRNVWVIYTVEQQSALSYLESVKLELFPDGWDPDNYSTGINPGDYDADKLDAFTELWETSEEATEENAEEIADALLKAYNEFKNSFVNFGKGYYVFTTFRSSTGALFDNTGNVAGAKAHMYTYTDPAVAITHTQNGTEFSIGDWDVYDPEDDDAWMGHAAAPYFVWEVIPDGNGMYYVKNWKTGQYIGGAPKDANGNLKPSSAPILMTKTPEASYNMKPSTNVTDDGVLAWQFYSDELTKVSAWGGGWAMGGLHAPGDVLNMVTWNAETNGSCWVPRTITEADLAKIELLNVQATLNFNLSSLVKEATDFVEDTKVYSLFDLETGKPAVGLNVFENLDVDGLVTDESQLDSNSIHEGDGHGLVGLLDGDYDTFYHSGWNDTYAPKSVVEVEDPETGEISEKEVYDKHYLQMDLGKACSEITVKWFTRGNGNVQGRLYKTTVYASNDGENYEKVTEGEFHYTPFNDANKVTVDGVVKNGWVGVCSYKLGAAYQYVRIEHTENVHGEARPWMNGAELRVYEGYQYEYKYDEENSPFESVPAEIVTELEKQLEVANEELADEAATQNTIDALKAAYEAFKSHTPDPSVLKELIDYAKGVAESAEVGTEPGYFTQAAIDALNAAIADAEGKYSGSMAIDAIIEVKAALQAALDAFQAALIKPVAGYYVIKSQSRNENGEANGQTDAIVYTQNSSLATNVKHGYNTEKTLEFGERVLGSYWKVENVEGGFTFKNVYSGLYLAPVGPETAVVAQSIEPYVFALQFAQTAGCFNLVLAEKDATGDGKYIYVNCQPGTGNLVTWPSAKGQDNSAWSFTAVAESDIDEVLNQGFIYELEKTDAPQVVTFPFGLYIENTKDAKFYRVKGLSDNADIQLEEVDEVVAGQAYILVPQTKEARIALFTEAEELAELTTTRQLKDAYHGLQGVFEETKVPAGFGVFTLEHDKVTVSEGANADKVAANTGFFGLMPVTADKGDAFIPASGNFLDLTGINNVITSSDLQKGIFSISGVRVNNINNLPAGLYIINGKKIVK